MSRAIVGEYVLTGVLVADSALAIGSGEEGAHTDMACVRDGQGRWIIPGSALAGLFSAEYEKFKPWGCKEFASQLFIEDAVWSSGPKEDEVRDGVGIDRRTGTAAPTALYTREVIPVGTRFNWELRLEVVEGELDRNAAREWLRAMAAKLASGVALGAATSAGLGTVRLDGGHRLQWIGIGNRDELLGHLGVLAGLGGSAVVEPLKLSTTPPPNRLRITCAWKALGPLLVSVPVNGLADRLPRTTRKGARENVHHLVIPGTSIKGVLRSRAEWIVRTVAGVSVPARFLDQMNDPGVIGQLFGRPPLGRGRNRTGGRRGAIRVHEVLSARPLPNWPTIVQKLMTTRPGGTGDDRLTARAKSRKEASDAMSAQGGLLRINDHVAISRWTGGADEGKLFATVAPLPADGFWERIVLDIDLSRFASGRDVDRALLLLAVLLRDLTEGWIGIGHGTTRGYGEVTARAEDIQWEFSATLPHGLTLPEPSFSLADLLGGERFAALRARLAEVGLADAAAKDLEEARA